MMKNRYVFTALFLMLSCMAFSNTFDRIKSRKVAISLGRISLHSDTALHLQTNIVLEDGMLLDILQQSSLFHNDKDENQQFRWYKVRTGTNQIGWVFGDAIAVFSPKNAADTLLLAFSLKKWNLSASFGASMSWLASVEGKELKSSSDAARKVYREQYLVFSNQSGKSISLPLTISGAEGMQQLNSFEIRDITGDADPEIIIEKAISEIPGFEVRNAEIYRFSRSGFQKIFEQPMTLFASAQTLTPARYKIIQIERKLIRISWVDFRSCQPGRFSTETERALQDKKKCVDYVTSTYGWDAATGMFTPIYAESRKPLKGFSKGRFFLRTAALMNAEKRAKLDPEDPITAIFVFSDFERSEEKDNPIWLYVETNSGQSGYIPAFRIYFEETEHADILNDYFSNPPGKGIIKKSEGKFVVFSAR